jgi:AcrR family transcriptional regulator
VPNDHRQRLIAAMAASVQEKGFRETTVADVVRIARTSRRTFYEQFDDRADCFLALFDATTEQVMATVAGAVDPGADWERQVDQALGAFLEAVASAPVLHRAFVRELPALGERGAERQLAVIERFAQQLVELVENARREQPESAIEPLPLDTAVIIVGGIRELLVIAAQQGRDVRSVRTACAAAATAIVRDAVLGAAPAARD